MISPTDLPILAKEKRVENEAFGRLLRQFPSSLIDPLVQQLYLIVSAEIDCTACANCCKIPRPAVLVSELTPLANAKGMTLAQFIENHTDSIPFLDEAGNQEFIYYLKPKPCPMLKGNLCSVYQERPLSCADFPHLDKPHFKYRFRQVLENYTLCPIVFDVVERLKLHIGQ
ncbi:MAG: YkgJ family cysteine cluster protein [Chloroherpetonaceae bacterium]|nr:YkgJ family cysteine cluster protein [Chloroherpetonaceae bacterium]